MTVCGDGGGGMIATNDEDVREASCEFSGTVEEIAGMSTTWLVYTFG